MNCMMKIIAPLSIKRIATMRAIVQQPRIVQIALCNQMQRPAHARGDCSNDRLEFCQKMARAEVEDAVDCVQAEGVELVVFQPVHCVLDKEPPPLVAVLAIEIDRLSPRSAVTIGKVTSECI